MGLKFEIGNVRFDFLLSAELSAVSDAFTRGMLSATVLSYLSNPCHTLKEYAVPTHRRRYSSLTEMLFAMPRAI